MAETISVRVRAFAMLREALGTGDLALTVPTGTTVAGLIAKLAVAYPDAALPDRRFTVAVNRAYAPPDRVLDNGDEVGLIPPVSGGAGKLFQVVDRPISIDGVASRVAAPNYGAITLFAGTVRGVTSTGVEQSDVLFTDHLEYEAYAEMTEAMLEDIAAEARARWPGIGAVSIVHRVGRLEVGDISIVIAVAAAHRQETFDACHYIIDRVKQIAPIWKREVGPDGASWVEGPESVP
jgi:molybdopterin synthase catalytic subunit